MHNNFVYYIDFVRCQLYNTPKKYYKRWGAVIKYLYKNKILEIMKETKQQKEKVEKVMHEYKEGDLKSGKDGKGGKVKSRQQAVAIAMSEAGISKKKSSKK